MSDIKLIENDLWLIWFEVINWPWPSKWEVFKQFKGFRYIHDNELLLVKYKTKYFVKQSKKIVKWDKVFLLNHNKEFKEFEFDEQWFINWIWFFQIFDEESWEFMPIVRWYSYEYIKEYEEFLNELGIKIEKHKKWAKLVSNKIMQLNEIEEEILSNENFSINQLLSFFAWLNLFYWRIQAIEKNDKVIIKGVQINLGLKDLYLQIEELIERFQSILEENKILISVTLNEVNLTIASHDYDFDNFIWEIFFWENYIVSKYENAMQIKEEILNKIIWKEIQIANVQEAKELLKNSQIKVLEY